MKEVAKAQDDFARLQEQRKQVWNCYTSKFRAYMVHCIS